MLLGLWFEKAYDQSHGCWVGVIPVVNVVPDIMDPKRNDAPDAPYHDELYREEERASVLQAQLVRVVAALLRAS